MKGKAISKRAKKLVRWHNSYVIFLTPEAKELGWNERTIVKISLLKDEKKIVIEKGMEL
jgi:hypothetical protein